VCQAKRATRITIDYFKPALCVPQWRRPEDWEYVLSTIGTNIFSNQNCELSLDESGDSLLSYSDGNPHGIKKKLAEVFKQRKYAGLNQVSWWETEACR
jgi:hypothetical protein